jgi:hypothetical protein
MSEDHVNRSLCSKKLMKFLRQLGSKNISHTKRCRLGEMRALIWFSRHFVSTSCTHYICLHHHQTAEQYSWLRSTHTLHRSCRLCHHGVNIASSLHARLSTHPPSRLHDTTPRDPPPLMREETLLHLRATYCLRLFQKSCPRGGIMASRITIV